MATIATYSPAKTPQNQQFFQLPFNEMYKVLSDTQMRSDIAKAEAEELSSRTFYNLPQDEMLAQEKRQWLLSSVDKLAEDYGDDPLKWTAGLQSLKKEIRREFDPTTGLIGKMQARYDQVVTRNAKLDETYKDSPMVRDYLKNNYLAIPLTGDPSQLDWGIIPGDEYRDVSEKEINEWMNMNLDNLEETTLEKFGLAQYGNLNEYTTAWRQGKVTGNTMEQVRDYLLANIPAEFMNSYYQKALAFGSPTAEQELDLLQRDENGKVLLDNGMMGLNPYNTLSQKIYGYMTGKAHTNEDYSVLTVQDELLKDARKKEVEEAKKTQNNTFVGWQKTGAAYEYGTPWGTSETSVSNFIASMDQGKEAFKQELLGQVVEQNIIDDISADDLMAALVDEDGVSAVSNSGNPIIKVVGKSGEEHYINNISREAWQRFKGNYEYNNYMKELAKEDFAEATATASKYMKDKYNKSVEEILDKDLKSLPKISGVDTIEALNVYGELAMYESQKQTPGAPRVYVSPSGDLVSPEYVDNLRIKANSFGASKEVIKQYEKAAEKNIALIKEYRTTLEKELAPSSLFTTLYTNDFGLSPELNKAANDQLIKEFDIAAATNFKGYTVGQKGTQTIGSIMNKVTKDMQEPVIKTVSVKKAMSPTPEGLYNWEVVYSVQGKGEAAKSVSVLVPEGEAGLQSPTIKSLNDNPYARAAKATTLAKMFNLTEFTLPDMPNVKLLGGKNGDWVMINGTKYTPEAAVSALAPEYAIRDLMAIWNLSYSAAKEMYKDMYGQNFDATYSGPIGPVEPTLETTE